MRDSDVSVVRSLEPVVQSMPSCNMVFDSEVSVVESLRRKRLREETRDPFRINTESQRLPSSPTTTWSPAREFTPFRTQPCMTSKSPSPEPTIDHTPPRPTSPPTSQRYPISSDTPRPTSSHTPPRPSSPPTQQYGTHSPVGLHIGSPPRFQPPPAEENEVDELYVDEDFDNLISRFGHLWLASIVSHDISISAACHLWKLAFTWIESIMLRKKLEGVKKIPQFAHLRRKLIKNLCPPVTIRVSYKDTDTGQIISPPPSDIVHHKQYSDIKKFQKLHEISSVKIKDVIKIHQSMNYRHKNDVVTVDLSCDGVADANSSGITMDMFTVSFPECRTVYPLVAIRPNDKSSINFQEELDRVLCDLKDNNVKIRNVLADNPMRALMRNCKNHASYFSCEYCRSSASFYSNEEEHKQAKKNHLFKVKQLKVDIAKLLRCQGSEEKIKNLRDKIEEADIELKSLLRRKRVSVNFLVILILVIIIFFWFQTQKCSMQL